MSKLEQNVAALANTELSSDELAQIERFATDADINIWSASSED